MKTPLYLLSALPFLVAALSSCEEKCPAPQPSLHGTWTWLRTDGGIANQIHDTPTSIGKRIRVQLNQDSTYRYFENGAIKIAGTYTLRNRRCIHDGKSKPVIIFNGSAGGLGMIEHLDKSGMSVSSETHDGVGSLYARF